MEWARLQELNSKSFEFNLKGLNKDQDLEESKNVENLGGASINGKRNVGKVWGPNLKQKGSGDFSSVFWLIPKEWNIL